MKGTCRCSETLARSGPGYPPGYSVSICLLFTQFYVYWTQFLSWSKNKILSTHLKFGLCKLPFKHLKCILLKALRNDHGCEVDIVSREGAAHDALAMFIASQFYDIILILFFDPIHPTLFQTLFHSGLIS